MSGTTEGEPTKPGEKGELAAVHGERPAAHPYPADSAEAAEWLDGHDYATSIEADEILPLGQERAVGEKEPSQGVKVPVSADKRIPIATTIAGLKIHRRDVRRVPLD